MPYRIILTKETMESLLGQEIKFIPEKYEDGYAYIRVKNYFKSGEEVEIISPYRDTISFVVPTIYSEDGEVLECARHPEEIVKFKLDKEVSSLDMMRIMVK